MSERIDPTLVNTDPATGRRSFALYSNTQGRFMRGSGTVSADGQRLRFVRDEALQAGHSYTLYVTYNTYLYDLAGNRINGTSRGFTTSGGGCDGTRGEGGVGRGWTGRRADQCQIECAVQ
ncbi:MAG: Ig-like domain-containing protein [Haliea sp.]|nr:Ig-like domain-containing protein [Haliea sp.]